MLLKNMLDGLKHELVLGDVNIDITSVQQDSRKIEKGSLFIAVKGFQSDGHKYINKAMDSGARAIVVTEVETDCVNRAKNESITLIKVDDDRYAMSHLASAFNKKPSEDMTVIGLTGTNGKTSTCRIISDMLNSVGISTGLLGTIANEIGGKTYKASLTTPEPVELHGLLKLMKDDKIQACVMEASSHALDLKRVDHVAFDYGVFTNLTEDHLDYHENFESYYKAKAKLFALAGQGRLINVDDVYGKRLYEECVSDNSTARVYSYAIDRQADIRAENVQYTGTGSRFTLVTPSGQVDIKVPLPGKIYVYNTLAAFGLLAMMDLSLQLIQKASKAISPVPGRMELVKAKHPVRVFVDYAHTPDALSNVIDIARSITDGRVITVFGCGGDRDTGKRPIMGRIAEDKSDVIYVTSDNPRTEKPESIINDVLAGLKSPDRAFVEERRKQAIGMAIKEARFGDVVLITGKGHETYQEINGVRHDFDDRLIALEYLEA